jgi:acetyltransferase-like isoleucine patch superfamily enzyme
MRRRVGARRFAAFGARSVVVPPAIVVGARYIHIGDEVLIHDRAWFSVVDEHNGVRHHPRLVIGDRTVFGRDAYFSCVGTIEIGSDVLAADRVFLTDTYHDYRDVGRPIRAQPMAEPRDVRIGSGAFLGVGSIVLAGVTIGEGAFVGAGAVVTQDVPAHAVVAGNPARVIRHWDAGTESWRDGPPAPGG